MCKNSHVKTFYKKGMFTILGRFNSEVQPPKFKKEARSRGCKAQAFSGSGVKFLSAICKVRCGVSCFGFLREILPKARPWARQWLLAIFWSKCNFLSDKALTWAVRMGEVHRCIQSACDGFMVGKFWKIFCKRSLKLSQNFSFFGNNVAKK